MTRKPVIGGNWKMNKTMEESRLFVNQFKNEVLDIQDMVEIVIIPPFTSILAVKEAIARTNIDVGAQNMYFEASGAFTGELSANMIKDAGATHVILGHSERRQIFMETDEIIAKKVKTALAHELTPIVCIGETREERERGDIERVLKMQVTGSLALLDDKEMARTILAYEPVWAIGTGLTATPAQAQEAHVLVRNLVRNMFSDVVAQAVRIQYGGSMKPENASELLSQPDIDGGLVGGASLDPSSFSRIVRSAVN